MQSFLTQQLTQWILSIKPQFIRLAQQQQFIRLVQLKHHLYKHL